MTLASNTAGAGPAPVPGTLLIVWHSRTGAARAMADAALAGAMAEIGDAARMVAAGDAQADDVLRSAGLLFVCPENLGALTGEMKAFFDRTYYAVLGRIEGRAYATAIAAGNAGQGAEAQLDRIVTGWRLRRVAPSLIVRLGADTPAAIAAPKRLSGNDCQTCRDLGRSLAAGLQIGVF
ncbi:flavodoxin family protein [Novosphingobium sp.]|uniref:flavodoxin family protein n=1 Tax=Novosphingobium sp. TaxID=1874826 RepID=UPI003340AD73